MRAMHVPRQHRPRRRDPVPGIVLMSLLLAGVLASFALSERGAGRCPGLEAHQLAPLEEAMRLIEGHGEAVWPRWREAPPFLVRAGDCEYLIKHPVPPEGFRELPQRVATHQVWALHGHLTPAAVATSWPVGSEWAAAVPVMAELQDAIDMALGPDVVVLDDTTYLRVLLHEAFHALQLLIVGGLEGLPRFGLSDEREALAAAAAAPEHSGWLIARAEALARALQASTVAETADAATAFLVLRGTGHEAFGGSVVALARALEWLEGSARYADTLTVEFGLDERPSGTPWERAAADVARQLEGFSDALPGLRDAYATVGAGQALVLDRLSPQWHGSVLPSGAAFDDVVRAALADRQGLGR